MRFFPLLSTSLLIASLAGANALPKTLTWASQNVRGAQFVISDPSTNPPTKVMTFGFNNLDGNDKFQPYELTDLNDPSKTVVLKEYTDQGFEALPNSGGKTRGQWFGDMTIRWKEILNIKQEVRCALSFKDNGGLDSDHGCFALGNPIKGKPPLVDAVQTAPQGAAGRLTALNDDENLNRQLWASMLWVQMNQKNIPVDSFE